MRVKITLEGCVNLIDNASICFHENSIVICSSIWRHYKHIDDHELLATIQGLLCRAWIKDKFIDIDYMLENGEAKEKL